MTRHEVNVFICMGGNLSSPVLGPPQTVMAAALEALPAVGIVVQRRSRWYRSAPVPPSAQPLFVNGVLEVRTSLTPDSLLAALHAVEADFGRCEARRMLPDSLTSICSPMAGL